MIESNKMPENSFRETGFYIGNFPNWRYTGRYGLVKHNIPMERLPRPYGDTESIGNCIMGLPIYMFEQLGETFRAFGKNMTTGYSGERSYTDDLKLLPYALVDFLPALFTTIAATLIPICLPIYLIIEGGNSDYSSILFRLALAFSPFIAAAGVLFAAWEMTAAALMFVKAGLETGFALLNILSIPFKGIASCISDCFDQDQPAAQEATPSQ